MRTSFSLLVLLALACAPCRAQTREPGKADALQPVQGGKSDDVLSPSTLPKERQNVKEQPGTARINALSPDEERRLERARARGAAKDLRPAAETHATSPSPAPVSETKTETKTAPKAGPKTESKLETKAEPTAPPATAAAPAAASRSAALARRQAERAVRRDRHVSRTARPDRDTADLDERRPRPNRGGADDRRERGPRVGDVVPPGVALYPLPPRAYGPPQAAMRAPLPFPRARDDEPDDDDGPPPRRFMTPY